MVKLDGGSYEKNIVKENMSKILQIPGYFFLNKILILTKKSKNG